MKRSLVQSTVVALLTLLQLVAPLVHAHAGYDDFSAPGVHLPGLEFYSPCKTHDALTSMEHYRGHSGVLVDVGAGVEKKRTKCQRVDEAKVFISLCAVFVASQRSPQCINPPPALLYFSPSPANIAAPVRAPPPSRLS